MIDITNFTFKELISSENCSLSENIPSSMEIIRNILYSAECLQLIRDKFTYPIVINSGYRNPALNKKVGGVSNSYHLQGLAYDIRPRTNTSSKLLTLGKIIDAFKNEHPKLVSEVIKYDTFIHVAFKFD